MNHLSGIDAAFLHLESPEMPMHVGSLNLLELPPGYNGDFFEDVKACLAGRLHLADVFTRKLALMPFDLSNPVWVEDEDIDLDHHVRHITLPKPGSNSQLQQYVARLHSTLLDRSRPLWEFFVIDGLRSGEVALYIKVHHARLDGQAGIALGRAIFDTEPTGRRIKPPRAKLRRNQYQLGVAELLGAAISNTVQQYVKLIKSLPAIARAAKSVLLPEKDEHGRRHWSLPKSLDFFAPRTTLNVAITNQRRFAARTMPLAEVKEIAKRAGVSLNDVVMATVAGALRDYFLGHHELTALGSLAFPGVDGVREVAHRASRSGAGRKGQDIENKRTSGPVEARHRGLHGAHGQRTGFRGDDDPTSPRNIHQTILANAVDLDLPQPDDLFHEGPRRGAQTQVLGLGQGVEISGLQDEGNCLAFVKGTNGLDPSKFDGKPPFGLVGRQKVHSHRGESLDRRAHPHLERTDFDNAWQEGSEGQAHLGSAAERSGNFFPRSLANVGSLGKDKGRGERGHGNPNREGIGGVDHDVERPSGADHETISIENDPCLGSGNGHGRGGHGGHHQSEEDEAVDSGRLLAFHRVPSRRLM